jgi:hypothetical protein
MSIEGILSILSDAVPFPSSLKVLRLSLYGSQKVSQPSDPPKNETGTRAGIPRYYPGLFKSLFKNKREMRSESQRRSVIHRYVPRGSISAFPL